MSINRCLACDDQLVDEFVGVIRRMNYVTCPSRHTICFDCFEDSATSQIGQLRIFEEQGCKLKCTMCPHIFQDSLVHLRSQPAKNKFTAAASSVAAAKSEREAQLKTLQDQQNRIIGSRIQSERVDAYFNEIVRRCIDFCCPLCGMGISLAVSIDYAHCTGIFCNCGAKFCLWCGVRLGDDYGSHVAACSRNPRPGSTNTSLAEVSSVKRAEAQRGILEYLQNNVPLEADKRLLRAKLVAYL